MQSNFDLKRFLILKAEHQLRMREIKIKESPKRAY